MTEIRRKEINKIEKRQNEEKKYGENIHETIFVLVLEICLI